MPGSNSREVTPRADGGWQVRAPGATRASAHADTQAEAVERARQIVRSAGGGEVVVHDRQGRVQVMAVGRRPGQASAVGWVSPVEKSASESGEVPSPSRAALPGAHALLLASAELEEHRALVAALANVDDATIVDPKEDRGLRLRRWLTLFEDELNFVRSVRNQVAHRADDVTADDVAAALGLARKLNDLFFARTTAEVHPGHWVAVRGSRVVDADVDPNELIARLRAVEDVVSQVVYQEALSEGAAE